MFLFVILFSLIPRSSVALSLGNQQCVRNSYDAGWSQMIHRVAIMPNDQTFGILEGGPKFGLSEFEVKWIRSIVGEVRCTNTKTKQKYRATGVIIGNDDQILTNAHTLLRDEGKADFNTCVFTTRTDPPVQRKLKLDSANAAYGTNTPAFKEFQDYGLAKLEKPIPNVKAIRMAKSISDVTDGTEILMLSAQMARMSRKVGPNEPVIQKCTAQKVLGADAESGTVIYSDCSNTNGTSGSLIIRRGSDGVLEGVALHTGGSPAEMDNQPYSYETRNFGQSLGFDDQLRTDLESFSKRKPKEP